MTDEEEMGRDVEVTGDVINVDTNEEGTYTVTITQDNLFEDQALAEGIPEIATAEDAGVSEAEMDRDVEAIEVEEDAAAVKENAPDGQLAVLGEEPSEGEAEAEAEPEAGTATEGESAAEALEEVDASEPADWSLNTVEQKDVTVVCNLPVATEGDEAPAEDEEIEPTFETQPCEILDFSNDNGTITITFKGVAGSLNSCTYTVRFAGTDAYAVVNAAVAQDDVVIEDVDYDAEVAALADYQPDFEPEEISLPEGVSIEDGEVVVADDAPDVVKDVIGDDIATSDDEEEMSRDGENTGDSGENATIKYLKESSKRKEAFENYDAVANYTPEVLGYINPTAGKVGEFGANAYNIFKGFYSNDWGAGIQGTLGILKMFGLFKGAGGGVSNEQILSEVQKVGIEVTDLHSLTKVMNSTLNETLQRAYANNLQVFDNAVISLHSNSEIIQNMLTEGAIRAAADGIEAPAEDCDAEDEFEYNFNLIEYIEGLEKAGGRKNSAFKGFTDRVRGLTDDFVLVAGEVAKPAETNPVKSYDKYWNLHFNYDTQGYYLRQAYRSDIEYELKRGFALMEIYYNIFDPETKGNYAEYNSQLFSALDRLSELNAGVSPEDLTAYTYWGALSTRYNKRVRCNTFNVEISGIYLDADGTRQGPQIPTGLLEEYTSRLHGRSLDDDLRLAGMWREKDECSNRFKWGGQGDYGGAGHGLAYNTTHKDKWWSSDIFDFDGKLHKGEKTYYDKMSKTFKPFDYGGNSAYHMPVLRFWFVS